VRPVDVVDDEDSFAATWGAGGVVDVEGAHEVEGVVDVEGAHEVEGVVKKWVVAGAREVEGVVDGWRGVNELFTLVDWWPAIPSLPT
jgi:hypothetical protein